MKRFLKAALCTAIPFAMAGCMTDSESEAVPAFGEKGRIVIIGSATVGDATVGGIDLLDPSTGKVVESGYAIAAYSTIGLSEGDVYAIDRTTGEITGFRGGRVGDDAAVTVNFNAGSGSNPYGVARIGDRLYVARFESAHLLVVRAADGVVVDSISLESAVAPSDSDGLPEMMGVVAHAGRLFVPVERLKRSGFNWTPIDSSLVLVVDPARKAIEQTIKLGHANPTSMTLYKSSLLLACTGTWASNTDGGVESVDLANRTARTLATEAVLKSNISDVVQVSEDRAFVVHTPGWPNSVIVPLDLKTGTLGEAIGGLRNVAGVAFDGTHLWAGNSPGDAPATVVKIDPATAAMVKTVEVPLPPEKLLFVAP